MLRCEIKLLLLFIWMSLHPWVCECVCDAIELYHHRHHRRHNCNHRSQSHYNSNCTTVIAPNGRDSLEDWMWMNNSCLPSHPQYRPQQRIWCIYWPCMVQPCLYDLMSCSMQYHNHTCRQCVYCQACNCGQQYVKDQALLHCRSICFGDFGHIGTR